jgi:predicted nucleic acid-binding protein
MSTATEQSVSTVGNVRRLAQYRPFERGGLDLRAVLHDLVLAVAAMEDGAVDSLFDCQKAFADCWTLEVEIDELRPIVDRLVESDLATRHGKGFRLSPATMADLEARARDWQQTEDRALREWELDVRQLQPGLAEEEMDLLRSDLRDWLHLIIGRHGADAAMMLYPEDHRARRFFDDVQAHGFDPLPDRPDGLRGLRERALPLFIRAPSPDQRRFLASLLNISFYMNVLTIDPQAKKLVQEQMTGHRIYLDTNFLYAVLGGAPPEEVYSSRRLVQLSKDLGFELAVTPWTVDELRTSIARSRRDIEAQQAFIRPELADAMVRSSGDKGFNRLYWQAYNQSKTQPKDVFDRLEHFELTLESYGIAVVDQGCTAVEQDEARIRDYSSLLNSERWPWQKDWVVLEHDAKSRLLVERLRGAGNLRFSNARYWFLTYDATLPRFAARVPDNGDSAPELAFCVSPSAWVQIIRALTPRTDDFDRTVVDLLTSPFVGYRSAVSPAVVQEVVGRMDHFEDASPELSIAVMADTAKVHEIEKAVESEDEDMIEEAVRAAYSTKAREMQDAVAASVRQAAQADEERRSAETRAVDADAGRRREQQGAEQTRLQIDREREKWDEEKRTLAADLAQAGQERDLAAGELEKRLADEGRRRRDRTILAGVALIVLGLAVALALPLAVVADKWAIAGAIVGGAALGLLGVRVVAGRNWGGEIVTWGSLLIAVTAVVVTIAGSAH